MTILNSSSVTIDTVVPTLSIGQIQVSADRRGTKEKPLTDAERIRRIVLPATHWGNIGTTLNGETSQGLTDVLRNALVSIAADKLRDTLAETPMARTVELADYTVSALLKFNAESASSRGSITFTREQVENWFDNSATRITLQAKYSSSKDAAIVTTLLAYVRNRFAALAAKNHGLKDATDATKLAALIDAADLDSSSAALLAEVVTRLDAINKQLTAKANEATISMDDL